ncbi:MAG TPA: hypothetical protein VLC71_00610 [Thermomonas sp.]|nr:hypothetical protein [Thermomonas sp.]
MRRSLLLLVVIAMLSGPAFSAEPVQQAAAKEQTSADYMSELQGERADIIAKNLTLTADQAAKFWPAYTKFEAEQAAIVKHQLDAITEYSKHFQNLDDASAEVYINATLDRDQRMHNLRKKWLREFKKILPAGTASRVIQIDRRLGLMQQLQLSSRIPLVH